MEEALITHFNQLGACCCTLLHAAYINAQSLQCVCQFYKYSLMIKYYISACYSKKEAQPCESAEGLWFNRTCFNTTYLADFDYNATFCNLTDIANFTTSTVMPIDNTTGCFNYTGNTLREDIANQSGLLVSPSEEYFK